MKRAIMQPPAPESLIARCLVDPGYLAGLMASGSAPVLVDGEALDLRRVRLFGGLITKVQHNDLWEDFPYTRAALKLLGVELEFFATYRDDFLRLRSSKPDKTTRVRSFLDTLESWLMQHWSTSAAAALDICRHERALWQTRHSLDDLAEAQTQAPVRKRKLGPAGVLTVVCFDHDPTEIMAAIRRAEPLDQLHARPFFVCYCGDPRAKQIRVVEVDGLTAIVLDRIGTGVEVDELYRQLSGMYPDLTRIETDRVLEVALAQAILRVHEVPLGEERWLA
jgi:hypothetical protein